MGSTVLVARRVPDRVHERPSGLAIADADGSNVRTFGFACLRVRGIRAGESFTRDEGPCPALIALAHEEE